MASANLCCFPDGNSSPCLIFFCQTPNHRSRRSPFDFLKIAGQISKEEGRRGGGACPLRMRRPCSGYGRRPPQQQARARRQTVTIPPHPAHNYIRIERTHIHLTLLPSLLFSSSSSSSSSSTSHATMERGSFLIQRLRQCDPILAGLLHTSALLVLARSVLGGERPRRTPPPCTPEERLSVLKDMISEDLG
jgi:hypothetical protein